jgi:probable UDP-sugar transporter A4
MNGNSLIWKIFLIGQIISYGAYPILINMSKTNGTVKYSTTAMNFLVEFFKLSFSYVCYLILKYRKRDNYSKLKNIEEEKKENDDQSLEFQLKTSLYYLLPALLYFINNNLVIYMLHQMDSATFQVLGNLKILTTAVLFYFIMGKSLSILKWFSLFLLFIAGIFYVFGNLKSKVPEETGSLDDFFADMYITHLGIIMILVYSFISGFAGVYSEKLLKQYSKYSIHTQNIYLYTFGTLFNLITAYSSDQQSTLNIFKIFNGFNFFTWIVILSQVFTGVSMSIVMKHADNIVRLFIISASLIVTAALSVLFFNLNLNFYFYFSFIAVIIACYFYLQK